MYWRILAAMIVKPGAVQRPGRRGEHADEAADLALRALQDAGEHVTGVAGVHIHRLTLPKDVPPRV